MAFISQAYTTQSVLFVLHQILAVPRAIPALQSCISRCRLSLALGCRQLLLQRGTMGPHCSLLGELAFPTTMLFKLFIALQHLLGTVTAPMEKEVRLAVCANLCIGSVACLQVSLTRCRLFRKLSSVTWTPVLFHQP